MTQDEAAIVALRALEHIAAEEALLRRFLLESGIEPAALARHTTEPQFLAGVLDFVMSDEACLLAFCRAGELAPEAPGEARRTLAGTGWEGE